MNEENISNEDLEASSNNTFDLALRPKKLDDFIGQKKFKEIYPHLLKLHQREMNLWIIYYCMVHQGWEKQL